MEETKAIVETGKEIITNGVKNCTGLVIGVTAVGTVVLYEGAKWGIKKAKAGLEKRKEKKSKVVEEPEKKAKNK